MRDEKIGTAQRIFLHEKCLCYKMMEREND